MTKNNYHKKNGYTYGYEATNNRINNNEFVKNVRKTLLEKKIKKNAKFLNFQ